MVRHIFPQAPVLRPACNEPFQSLGVSLIEETVETEMIAQLIPPADGKPVFFRVEVFPGFIELCKPVAAETVFVMQGLVDEGQPPISPAFSPDFIASAGFFQPAFSPWPLIYRSFTYPPRKCSP